MCTRSGGQSLAIVMSACTVELIRLNDVPLNILRQLSMTADIRNGAQTSISCPPYTSAAHLSKLCRLQQQQLRRNLQHTRNDAVIASRARRAQMEKRHLSDSSVANRKLTPLRACCQSRSFSSMALRAYSVGFL